MTERRKAEDAVFRRRAARCVRFREIGRVDGLPYLLIGVSMHFFVLFLLLSPFIFSLFLYEDSVPTTSIRPRTTGVRNALTHTHTCSIQSVFLDLCNCNDYYAKRILIVIEKKVGGVWLVILFLDRCIVPCRPSVFLSVE